MTTLPRRCARLLPLLALGCSAAGGAGGGDAGGAAGVGGSAAGGSGGSAATGGTGPGTGGSGGSVTLDGGGGAGGAPCVDTPPTPAGPYVQLGAAYQPHYRVFDLGVVPGIPFDTLTDRHLGGCVLDRNDPNLLLVAGDSETDLGAIYAIRLRRGPCGHIIGFDGTATRWATTPYVDANLLWGPGGVLLYSQWPVNRLGQILPGGTSPASDVELFPLGVTRGSISGIGFVPPPLAAQGYLRAITWADGAWYQLGLAGTAPPYTPSLLADVTTLPNGPGGFAYVPAGSPGFDVQSLILAEWSVDKVATYAVNDLGDPVPSTRQDFFTRFPRPWGAYFEPETGDFLFLTWTSPPDRVFIVQGFALPPPPPEQPR